MICRWLHSLTVSFREDPLFVGQGSLYLVHDEGEKRGEGAARRRGAFRSLPGWDHRGAGSRQSGGFGPGLLHGAAVAGRAQERRADGRPDCAGPSAGPAPVDAPCGGQCGLGRCDHAYHGAPAGAAGDRAARPSALLDRRRHRLPQAGSALGRRGPAILRPTGQAGQLPGRGEPVGGQ
jgi:hypothetical protein